MWHLGGKDAHHRADLSPIGTCPKMLDNGLEDVLRGREVTQIAHGQGFPVQSSNTARAVAPGDSCPVDKFIRGLPVRASSFKLCMNLDGPLLISLRYITLLVKELEIGFGFEQYLLGIDQGMPDLFIGG